MVSARIGSPSWVSRRGRSTWAAYQQVDIHLDTVPQTGGVTTLEGLTMGVPTLMILGDTIAGRISSASFLHVLGLDDLIARTPDEYVAVAGRARQRPRSRAHEGASHRPRPLRSPRPGTVNKRLRARAVEDAYRALWRRWCASLR